MQRSSHLPSTHSRFQVHVSATHRFPWGRKSHSYTTQCDRWGKTHQGHLHEEHVHLCRCGHRLVRTPPQSLRRNLSHDAVLINTLAAILWAGQVKKNPIRAGAHSPSDFFFHDSWFIYFEMSGWTHVSVGYVAICAANLHFTLQSHFGSVCMRSADEWSKIVSGTCLSRFQQKSKKWSSEDQRYAAAFLCPKL